MRTFRLTALTSILACVWLAPSITGETLAASERIEDVGTFLDLPDGNKMQFVVEDQEVVARYLSPERDPLESEVKSIVFLIDDPGHRHDEWRTLLQPVEGEEATFSSPRLLHGPYLFRTRVVITFTSAEPWTFTNLQLDLKRNDP